ncbi:hypothetical protein F9K91_02045 [Brucella tritici]|uniref:Uncharacterized protein n=1 Tax=Brucella tritici TaxID=94626 RepID=A0A833CR77_9HYPH|nr:hypothetical protein [Brucella tritici]KAB2667543.1 hypothetical protein F9K91_02045 [Brucella tritici]
MDIEYWQRWVTVVGLIVGFYGVLLLTAEWPYIIIDGVKKLAGLHENFELKRAKKVRASFENWTKKASSPYKWVRSYADGALKPLPYISKNIQSNLHDIASKYDVKLIDLVDENGIIVVDLVEKQCFELREFIDDLKDSGDPVNTSRRGLVYVLVALGFQTLGAVPIKATIDLLF